MWLSRDGEGHEARQGSLRGPHTHLSLPPSAAVLLRARGLPACLPASLPLALAGSRSVSAGPRPLPHAHMSDPRDQMSRELHFGRFRPPSLLRSCLQRQFQFPPTLRPRGFPRAPRTPLPQAAQAQQSRCPRPPGRSCRVGRAGARATAQLRADAGARRPPMLSRPAASRPDPGQTQGHRWPRGCVVRGNCVPQGQVLVLTLKLQNVT